MSSGVDGQEGEVTTALHCTNFIAVTSKLQVTKLDLVELVLAGPFKSLSPGMVAEIVADEILKKHVRTCLSKEDRISIAYSITL